MNKISFMASLTFVLLLVNMVSAEVEIEKKVSDSHLNSPTEKITVTIGVHNLNDVPIEGELNDRVPTYASVLDKELISGISPMVHWQVRLEPGETREFSYLISFSDIPASSSGEDNITLYPASFIVDDIETESEAIFLSIRNVTRIEGCDFDFVCEPELGEMPSSCIQDCYTYSDEPSDEAAEEIQNYEQNTNTDDIETLDYLLPVAIVMITIVAVTFFILHSRRK